MRFTLALMLSTGIAALSGCDSGGDSGVADTRDTRDTSASDVAPADTTPPPDQTDETDTSGEPTCADLIDGCLRRQRTCVVDDGGEAKCAACPDGHYAARPDGACTALGGTKLTHDFGVQTVQGGQEIGSLCQTWILDNDEELWVNAVEMDNDGGYHHSNWFFVPEDHENWPTGPWLDCYDEGFHEVSAALAGGVLYAQSTQVKHELQKFQSGAAVHIPPRSRVITVTHLLNYLTEPLDTGLRLTLYTLPRAEVVKPLSPGQLIYSDLAIPGQTTSSWGGTCDIAKAYGDLFEGAPLAMKLHYVLPHYHALGAGFELTIVGGAHDGEKIVDLGAFTSDPFGFAFDPPLDLDGATGLKFACLFDNPREDVVHWGIGDQEMCEALLFFESPMAFTAGVGETASESTVADMPAFSGECRVIGFPFDPMD